MDSRFSFGRGAAILACTASLAAAGATAAPTAGAAAPSATSCGSKTIEVSDSGAKPVSVPVSRIRVEGGATCSEATAVIRGALLKNPPQGWVVRPGKFKVPHGLVAERATKGAKVVEYATVGPSS